MTAVKYPPPVSKDWAFWEWCDIPSWEDRTQVYLRRLRIVQTPYASVLLHFVYLPDTDPDPHDHPWNFWSFIVRGGYTEKIVNPYLSIPRWVTKTHRMLSLHRMSIALAHQITRTRPGTISLVFTGARQREWGFWRRDSDNPTWGLRWQFIPFKEYDKGRVGTFESIDEFA